MRGSILAFAILTLGTATVHAMAPVDYRRDVLPILKAKCLECHQGSDASSGHRLDRRDEILGETTGHPLAKLGKSADSSIVKRLLTTNPKRRMPPEGERLSAMEVATLRRWIDEGLKWDDESLSPAPSKHWAFQPIQRPNVPKVRDPAWSRNPVDAFIAATHEERQLSPAPAASRRTLIRRLSLDLLGLPPTESEIIAFERDTAPDAYDRVVERLLHSPHHGERWGRHWLDIARWAESEGYESNHPRPFAWRYRDYVVRSFHEDRPYDQFLTQQIAGDELSPYRDDNLIATGFLAAARLSSNEEDKSLQRNQVLVDVVNTTGTAFLGLTVGCAQCHNHKFDPFTLREYYRLMAYFQAGQPVNVGLDDALLRREYSQRQLPEYEQLLAERDQLFERARQLFNGEVRQSLPIEMRQAYDTPADQRSPEQERLARQADLKFQATPNEIEKRIPPADRSKYDALKNRIAELEPRGMPPQTWAYFSPVTSPHRPRILPSIGFYPLPYDPIELARSRTYLLVRGEVHALGPIVSAGVPESVGPKGIASASATDRPQRIQLARWLTDPTHPLTARVWANRIWQFHFGRGLVATSDDFGLRGEVPSHPALLDWLARELIESGWSTRHLHRLIVTSNTYRQSAIVTADARHRDPDGRYLSRWPIRRLESEAIRDMMLAVTDELDRHIGGPSVPAELAETSHRRSIYLFHRRGRVNEMQSLFDAPNEASESCTRRHTSTTSLQSLFLLNHPFTRQRAEQLAKCVSHENRNARINAIFVRVLGRLPDTIEQQAAQRFLDTHSQGGEAAWIALCQAMLNTNELIYID